VPTRKPPESPHAQALLALPEEAYEDLFGLVKRSDVQYAEQLVQAVNKLDRALLPPAASHPLAAQIALGTASCSSLLDLMERGSEREWYDAVDALAHVFYAQAQQTGSVDKSFRARLKAQLKHVDPERAALVAKVLSLGRDDGILSEQLHRLADDDPGVVAAAARLLGMGAYRPAARLLADMISPQRTYESRAIIWAVGELGDPVALPRLRQSIENGFRVVDCLIAMGKLGDVTVLGGIMPIFMSGLPEQRDAAHRALAMILDKHRGDQGPVQELFSSLRTLIETELNQGGADTIPASTRLAMCLSLARMGVQLDAERVKRYLGISLDAAALTPMARVMLQRAPTASMRKPGIKPK
jgi:hypothetical protein